MTRLVEIISRLLEREERDAVLGDFAESGAVAGRALLDLLGLVARRQAALWKSWRPWLALLGLGIPFALVLGQIARRLAGTSAIYSWMYLNNWTWRYLENGGFRMDLLRDAANFGLQYLALILWSWTFGYALASFSRGAIWIIGSAFCVLVLGDFASVQQRSYGVNAAAFAVGFYRVAMPVILRVALVLIPAVWGMYKGVRLRAFSNWSLLLLGIVLFSLSDFSHLLLAWPAAYVIATRSWKRWHAT